MTTEQLMIPGTKRHPACIVMRRVLTTHYQVNAETGKRGMVRQEWNTQRCGTSLFSGDDVYGGVCSACRSGWKHPHNYPAGEAQPERCADATHPECDPIIRDPATK